MADNIDSLLCDEEGESFCFDDNDGGGVDEKATAFVHVRSDSQSMLAVVTPFLSDECIGWMLERERFHLVRHDYLMRLRSGELDMSLRRQALDWMFKACAHHNFGELCLHLAVNYLDRFLSVYHLPVGKTWAVQFAAVACLSLAAKVDEVHIPSTIDLQAGEPKYLFEGKTVQRMEILVLSSLSWNVKPYTPFNFIDYFLRKLNDVEIPPSTLISRSIQVILSTIKGIDFLEFKPSEIAAAVATYVSAEEQKQALDIDKTLSGFIVVEKAKVMKCLEMIQDLITISGSSCSSSTISTITMTTHAGGNNGLLSPLSSSSSLIPESPNGVLDVAEEPCMSCKSDGSLTVSRSCPCSSSDRNKRRRLD